MAIFAKRRAKEVENSPVEKALNGSVDSGVVMMMDDGSPSPNSGVVMMMDEDSASPQSPRIQPRSDRQESGGSSSAEGDSSSAERPLWVAKVKENRRKRRERTEQSLELVKEVIKKS